MRVIFRFYEVKKSVLLQLLFIYSLPFSFVNYLFNKFFYYVKITGNSECSITGVLRVSFLVVSIPAEFVAEAFF